jgi:acyl-CoA synthetase (AMP-forming)/AMP-acid ligase II
MTQLTSEAPPAAAATNLAHVIRSGARQRSDDLALIDAGDDRSYTFGEVDRLIGRFAAGLAALGFRPGDALLLVAPNSPEWIVAALGALTAGGVMSGVDPASSAADIARRMRETGARFAFADPSTFPAVREATLIAGGSIVITGRADGAVSFTSVVGCADREPDVPTDPAAVAALVYTAGTAGSPKAVVTQHDALLANIARVAEIMHSDKPHIGLIASPLSHITGLLEALVHLAGGTPCVLLPKFDAATFLPTLQQYRITNFAAAPPVVQFMADHLQLGAYDLSALDYIVSTAAPLPVHVARKATERLGCKILQRFDMAESLVLALSRPTDYRFGSAGRIVPEMEAQIVDPETRAVLPNNAPGELWFRGPYTARGYRDGPHESAPITFADGWVRSGDFGYLDKDGYLFVIDRLDDVITVKDLQVAPAELEGLLLEHPHVADAAVIARTDPRAGRFPVAYIVVRKPVAGEAIKTWLSRRVVPAKKLGAIVVVDAIPKSTAGTILRRALRERDAATMTA